MYVIYKVRFTDQQKKTKQFSQGFWFHILIYQHELLSRIKVQMGTKYCKYVTEFNV